MTLNETWKRCLKMWRWVVKEWKKDKSISINDLKAKWLAKYDPDANLQSDCYFCQYALRGEACEKCPGTLVDKDFVCFTPSYAYDVYPDKFLAKLEQLNKKRLRKNPKLAFPVRMAKYELKKISEEQTGTVLYRRVPLSRFTRTELKIIIGVFADKIHGVCYRNDLD